MFLSREIVIQALANHANFIETGDPLVSLSDLKEQYNKMNPRTPENHRRMLEIGTQLARTLFPQQTELVSALRAAIDDAQNKRVLNLRFE